MGVGITELEQLGKIAVALIIMYFFYLDLWVYDDEFDVVWCAILSINNHMFTDSPITLKLFR